MIDENLIEEMSEYYDDEGELTEIKINTKAFSNIIVKDNFVIFKKVQE